MFCTLMDPLKTLTGPKSEPLIWTDFAQCKNHRHTAQNTVHAEDWRKELG